MHIPGEDLTVVVDFSAGNNGAWTGSITMPGLNTKGLPLKDIVLKGSDATFAIKTSAIRGFEATFKGHLDGNGKLTGAIPTPRCRDQFSSATVAFRAVRKLAGISSGFFAEILAANWASTLA